jgi:hypothetical protein
MGRQAPGPGKDLGIFTQRVKRNQSAHAGAHDKRLFLGWQGAVRLVDKRFDLRDHKTQVVVGAYGHGDDGFKLLAQVSGVGVGC